MSKEPTNPPWERIHQFIWCITCKQALPGALAVGQEKEGELAITSLEFEYLHRKSQCKMLIGRDDISNDVVTFGICLSIFVYMHSFHFALTGTQIDWQLSWRGATEELKVEFKFQRCSCKLSFLFPRNHHSALESLIAGYLMYHDWSDLRSCSWSGSS